MLYIKLASTAAPAHGVSVFFVARATCAIVDKQRKKFLGTQTVCVLCRLPRDSIMRQTLGDDTQVCQASVLNRVCGCAAPQKSHTATQAASCGKQASSVNAACRGGQLRRVEPLHEFSCQQWSPAAHAPYMDAATLRGPRSALESPRAELFFGVNGS